MGACEPRTVTFAAKSAGVLSADSATCVGAASAAATKSATGAFGTDDGQLPGGSGGDAVSLVVISLGAGVQRDEADSLEARAIIAAARIDRFINTDGRE